MSTDSTQKLNKHDTYLEDLASKIENKYDLVLKNIPLYSQRKRLIGEIDLVGVKGENFDVFEVKCSFRPTKARKQLKKIQKHYRQQVKNLFFYCGESGQLLEVS